MWINRRTASIVGLIALIPQIPIIKVSGFNYQLTAPFRVGLLLLLDGNWLDTGVGFTAGIETTVYSFFAEQEGNGPAVLGLNFAALIPAVWLATVAAATRGQRKHTAVRSRMRTSKLCAIAIAIVGVSGFSAWWVANAAHVRLESARSYLENTVREQVLHPWDADTLLEHMEERPREPDERSLRELFGKFSRTVGATEAMHLDGDVHFWAISSNRGPDASFSGPLVFASGHQGEASITLRYVDRQWKIISLRVSVTETPPNP